MKMILRTADGYLLLVDGDMVRAEVRPSWQLSVGEFEVLKLQLVRGWSDSEEREA